MYYPIGLPKQFKFGSEADGEIRNISCNRDRVLFAILCDNSIWIWFSKPCLPLTSYTRNENSIIEHGRNVNMEWRPDSSMIAVSTSKNTIFFYSISTDPNQKEAYEQVDSPLPGLRRYSAELYTKEKIPSLNIKQVYRLDLIGNVTCIVCLRDELMVGTHNGHIQRVKWDGSVNYDYCIDLSRVPFCDDQLVMKAVPLEVPQTGVHVIQLEYSPLVGGFAIVLSDGRAAFLTASTLKFDPNAVQGIWARDLDDVRCAAINHKYRLIVFGRENSEGVAMVVDEATGGLEVCHQLCLSSKDYTDDPGPVECMRWTPDGTVLGICWRGGGVSLWSVFGSLLCSSLQWDYSENSKSRPMFIIRMEWGAEGYEAWCLKDIKSTKRDNFNSVSLPLFNPNRSKSESQKPRERDKQSSKLTFEKQNSDLVDPDLNSKDSRTTSIVQITFIKSVLTVNPCMSKLERVVLQGSDRIYISPKEACMEMSADEKSNKENQYSASNFAQSNFLFNEYDGSDDSYQSQNYANKDILNAIPSRNWIVIPIPYSYTASNWPIRYTCMDDEGDYVGVAGRNGVAHYSLRKRKWRLFGNENQEEDLVVTGGLLWWKNTYLSLGAYNILSNEDEIRFYNKNNKLDNEFATIVSQPAQVLLINVYSNQMIALTADCRITVYNLKESKPTKPGYNSVSVTKIQEVDVSALTIHPACVVSVCLTSLRTESWRSNSSQPVQLPTQSIIFNISGKVLMIQRDISVDSENSIDQKLFQKTQMTPIVLASCCETLWCASRTVSHKPHLSHALWLHCGFHGTRAWLPLFPSSVVDRGHTFMARRIMLPFNPSIYPLAVLFEEAIMIGAESDWSTLACDSSTLYQPLTFVQKNSQVYLHHLLRQMLRRNLGYHAWEVADTCKNLPYFSHSLELLLHQVLEEEATSKDPIPDCLLPRVLDFIREFPVHLKTIVQCARKSELALWHYLFSVAGSPKHLFSQALSQGELETAASYLIILQNMESAMVSRTYATRLLDASLEASKWELSKDLIRFLRSIDPTDLESPKSSPPSGGTRVGLPHVTPPVSPQCADEDLTMIMPNTKALRCRSYSTTSGPKIPGSHTNVSENSSIPLLSRTISEPKNFVKPPQNETRKTSVGSMKDDSADQYFLDVILQRRAKKLLLEFRLRDLGIMAAQLDFPLVSWLKKEKMRAGVVHDFVATLIQIHQDFMWPLPVIQHSKTNSIQKECLARVEDRMRQLSVNVPKVSSLNGYEIGDSGYLSQSTNTGDTGTPMTPRHQFLLTETNPHSVMNKEVPLVSYAAMLAPHSQVASTDILSIMSEEGSLIGDDGSMAGGVDWGPEVAVDPTRNLLARSPDPPLQVHPKPPPYSEVQLRYLLQIFLEAGCLEISLLLAVVLRDALAVLRVVSMARSPETTSSVISRLVKGLENLKKFSDSQCFGYQSFMSAVMSQTKVLQRLAETRIFNSSLAAASKTLHNVNSSQRKMSADTSFSRDQELLNDKLLKKPVGIIAEDQDGAIPGRNKPLLSKSSVAESSTKNSAKSNSHSHEVEETADTYENSSNCTIS